MARSPRRLMSKILAKGEKITRSFYHRVHHEPAEEEILSETAYSPGPASSDVPVQPHVNGSNVREHQAINVDDHIVPTVHNRVPCIRDFAYPANHIHRSQSYLSQVAHGSSPVHDTATEALAYSDSEETIQNHFSQVTSPDALKDGVRSGENVPEHVSHGGSTNESQVSPINDDELRVEAEIPVEIDVIHVEIAPAGFPVEQEATVSIEVPATDHSPTRNVSECTLVSGSSEQTLGADHGMEAVIERPIAGSEKILRQSSLAGAAQINNRSSGLDQKATTSRGNSLIVHGSNTSCTLIASDEDTALELLLKTRQQGCNNDIEELRDEFADKIKYLEQDHADVLTHREQMHQIVVKQLQRDVKAKNREKQRLEEAMAEKDLACDAQLQERNSLNEQISQFIRDFQSLQQRSKGNEAQLKKEIWYLQETITGKDKQLSYVTDKYDLCIRDYGTTHNKFREIAELQRSKILSLEDELTTKKDVKARDQTALNQAIAQANSLQQQLMDMTRYRDILAHQNIIQQQNAEVWESKAHCLQGIQEGILDPLSYNPEGLLAFKDSELKKLEERSGALLTEHERLESTSKFDAEVCAAKIKSLISITARYEETIEELREQKANYQQANEGLLDNLKHRISDQNIVRIDEQYHQLVRGENLKLADQARELQLKLNAANEKIADEEIRHLKTARDMSALRHEHSECNGSRRELENKVSTLEMEVDTIPQDYEKVIKPMTAKIEAFEHCLQQNAVENQRLRSSRASEVIRKEFERKDREIAHLSEQLQQSQNDKAEVEKAYEEQTYYRSLDLGYAQCHEDAMEDVRHRLKKVESERDALQEQLSFCKPMRRYEFRDYQAEIAEARALAQARDEELQVDRLLHQYDLGKVHGDCDELRDLVYNLQNLNLHVCGRMDKLEKLLKKHDITPGDGDHRHDLLAWCKELLSTFKSDEEADLVGDSEAVSSGDKEEAVFCEMGELPEGEHNICEAEESLEEDAKDNEELILCERKKPSEDIQKETVVGAQEEFLQRPEDWETDGDSEETSDLLDADSSEPEAQEPSINSGNRELSEIAKGKQRASSSPASPGWYTISSSA